MNTYRLVFGLLLLLPRLVQAQTPTITAFSPTSGPIGTTVIINGTNFSTTPANNIVYFGATKATVTAATATQLTVTVPAGATSIAPITVQDITTGLQASSLTTIVGSGTTKLRQFTVTTAIPFTPNYGASSTYTFGNACIKIVTGDFDGINGVDIATVDFFNNNVFILLKNGSGAFTLGTSVNVGANPFAIAVADFNSDGKMDLAVEHMNGGVNIAVSIRLGNGNGTFYSPATPEVPSGISNYAQGGGIVTGDFNGDGKIDFATHDYGPGSLMSIRLGDGLGGFSAAADVSAGANAYPYSLAVGDFNGDGKADLATANINAVSVSIRLGDGNGAFTGSTSVPVGSGPDHIQIGDFNGDGNLDFATSNVNDHTISIKLGDGSGNFSSGSLLAVVDANSRLALGDFNGDGKTDIVTGNITLSGLRMFLGNGSGGASVGPDISLGGFVDMTVGDFNGDGKADLAAITNGNTVKVFVAPNIPTITSFSPTSGIIGAAVTINGSNFSTTPTNNIVYFGATKATVTAATATQLTVTVPIGTTYNPINITVNGLTAFSTKPFNITFANGVINDCSFDAPVFYSSGNYGWGVAMGDLDGDGKTDIAVANVGLDAIQIFRNTGNAGTINAGSFASSLNLATGDEPYGVAIADIDHDGKLDIVATSSVGNLLSVYRNISTAGTLTAASFEARVDFATNALPFQIVGQDLDSDGKTDIAIASSNSLSIWKNVSTPGVINTSSLATKFDLGISSGSGIVIADLDVDGKPDLIGGAGLGSSIKVFKNIGNTGALSSASFAASVDIPIVSWAEYVTVGDLDNDNRPDVVASSWPTGSMAIVKNTSTAGTINASSFAAPITFTGLIEPRGVVITDFDGDGYPDIGVASQITNTVSIYKNLNTPGVITTASFAPRIAFAAGGNTRSVLSGDIDGDGKPDLVVTNWGGPPMSVVRNSIGSTLGSLSPVSGFIGTTVTITGTNFSVTPSNNVVKFNGVAATIISNTQNSIVVKVPIGATTGLVTVDVCGQPALGSLSFTVTTFAPSICNSISLNGTTDYMAITDNPVLRPTSLTVETFVNFSSLGVSVILSKSFGVTNQKTYSLWYSSGLLYFGFNGYYSGWTLFTPIPGRWYHIAISHDNVTQKQVMYLDGVEVSSTTGTVPIYDTNPHEIGSDFNFGTHGYFFNGKVAEMRIWDTARTEAEIQSTINTSLAGNEPGLLTYYKLNETGQGAGVTVANSATATGAALNGVTFGTASTPVFVYTCNPTISSFTPANGPVGTTVTITGTNFSSTPANNIVYFGATKATVTAATATQLTVTVPTGATYQPISVLVNGLTAYSARPFLVTFAPSGTLNTCSFNTQVGFAVGAQPIETALGDLDGDGKADLAAANYNSHTVSVVRNTSTVGSITSTSFASTVNFSTGASSFPRGVAIGDLDGDGKPDLVTANFGGTISVFRNISSPGSFTAGSFATRVDFPCPGAHLPAIQDLDGDGKPEIAVTTYQFNSIAVFHNTSTVGTLDATSFSPKVDFTTLYKAASLAIADIDGDGKPDLIDAHIDADRVSILRNQTTTGVIDATSFAPHVDIVTGSGPNYLMVGDLDNDSKPELVVTNFVSATVSVIKNISTAGTLNTGSFATKVDFATGAHPSGIAINDLDGDGDPDLAIGNFDVATISVYKNTTAPGIINTSSFSTPVSFSTGDSPQRVLAGDLDGDGRPELIGSTFNLNYLSIIRNQTLGLPTLTSFTPGNGPVGTPVIITGTNFDTTPANNMVMFNGVAATVTASTATSITTTVPAGATTGTITVTVGCNTAAGATNFNVFSASITINPQPQDESQCLGYSKNIITVATGTTNIQYRWQFSTVATGPFADINNGGGYSFVTSTSLAINTAGNFGEGFYRCRINGDLAAEVFTNVVFFDVVIVTAPTASDVTVCAGGPVVLTATGGTNGNYRWVDSDNSVIPGEVNGTYTYTNNSNTSISVFLVEGTCESPRVTVSVTISPCTEPPVIEATEITVTVQGNTTLELLPLLSDPDNDLDLASLTIVQQPGSGAVATINGTILSIDYEGLDFLGTDNLRIRVCDLSGNCAEQDLSIEVVGSVTAFNALSPGDDGKNDIFLLQYVDILEATKNNHVTIFNRWGDVVWETKDYNNTTRVFKGLNKNGNELPSGVYFYRVTFSSGEKQLEGFISLKR